MLLFGCVSVLQYNRFRNCLNPCCSGCYFLGRTKRNHQRLRILVLILVVVDVTFCVINTLKKILLIEVLILVVVDVTFWAYFIKTFLKKFYVLILVVVDVTFWVDLQKAENAKLSGS